MKYALVNTQGDILNTREFDEAPPILAQEKGIRWIPDNPPVVDPETEVLSQVSSVALDATEVGYQILPVNLTAFQQRRKEWIESCRDSASSMPVVVFGRPWQAGTIHRDLLTQAVVLASAGLALPPFWRDADNNNMAVTDLQQLLDIAGAMSVQVNEAYARSWQRKAEIEAVTDETSAGIAEVQAVVW